MTRDQLVTMIESYAKRDDLTALIASTFIPLAESRIGRDLRSRENETLKAYTDAETADRFLDLPADYGRVRALESDQDRGPVTLVSHDVHSINRFDTGGTPMAYCIRGTTVEVRPFNAGGTFTLYYWRRPKLESGLSTDPVLDRYPSVYLYASLAELHGWERDEPQAEKALRVYDRDVALINRNAERESGDKPAMRRA